MADSKNKIIRACDNSDFSIFDDIVREIICDQNPIHFDNNIDCFFDSDDGSYTFDQQLECN